MQILKLSIMKKKLQSHPIYLFLVVVLLVIMGTSCNKLSTNPDEKATGALAGFNSSQVLLKGATIELDKGILNIQDTEKLSETFLEILNMRESDLDKWEASIGFKSLRTVVNEANYEFGELQNETQFAKWKEKYKDVVELRDSTVTELVGDRLSQVLSNRAGEYKVGTALIKAYNDKVVTILDGDRSKLLKASRSVESQFEEGIMVEMSTASQSLLTQPNLLCSGGRHLSGKVEHDKRRAYITYTIKANCDVNVSSFCRTWIDVRFYGQKKTLFGWNKYKTRHHGDNIRFSLTDNGVFYPLAASGGFSYESFTDENEGYMAINMGNQTYFTDYQTPGSFDAARGRSRTRGTGNNYAVICCGNAFVGCPPASD